MNGDQVIYTPRTGGLWVLVFPGGTTAWVEDRSKATLFPDRAAAEEFITAHGLEEYEAEAVSALVGSTSNIQRPTSNVQVTPDDRVTAAEARKILGRFCASHFDRAGHEQAVGVHRPGGEGCRDAFSTSQR